MSELKVSDTSFLVAMPMKVCLPKEIGLLVVLSRYSGTSSN